ncbi:MAG: tryptophan synthase subunit alpha [bacterium]|nr:tryptophan synthase subunit alpha [bacterium]
MSNTRYSKVFRDLAERREGAFVPFTVLGDPDPEASLEILRAFARGGADMVELGIPFSDPVADGPVIQAADLRARAAGVTPDVALGIIKRFRDEYPEMPIGLLLYANLIHKPGLSTFYRDLAAAGVDSVLIPDVPLEESAPFKKAADANGVDTVFMATPSTTPERLGRIVKQGGAYLYTVSRVGVTGQDSSLSDSAAPLIKKIRRIAKVPILLGFGISKPDQVRAALTAGADGAICGSAVVNIIAEHVEDWGCRGGDAESVKRLCVAIKNFVTSMKRKTIV